MTTLDKKGLFNSPEELINKVFSLNAKDVHPNSIKRMCGVSVLTLSEILEKETPSITTQKEILKIKMEKGEAAGQNMEHLNEDMSELTRLENIEKKENKKSNIPANKNSTHLTL